MRRNDLFQPAGRMPTEAPRPTDASTHHNAATSEGLQASGRRRRRNGPRPRPIRSRRHQPASPHPAPTSPSRALDSPTPARAAWPGWRQAWRHSGPPPGQRGWPARRRGAQTPTASSQLPPPAGRRGRCGRGAAGRGGQVGGNSMHNRRQHAALAAPGEEWTWQRQGTGGLQRRGGMTPRAATTKFCPKRRHSRCARPACRPTGCG